MGPYGRGIVAGALAGVGYGLLVYLWLHRLNGDVGVMVSTYLFAVPFALGVLSAQFVPPPSPETRPPDEAAPDAWGDPPLPRLARPQPLVEALLVSCATVTTFLVVATVTGFEGVLCAFLAAPAMYVVALPGALLGLGLRTLWRRARTGALLLTLGLPALLGPLEQARPLPGEYRTVTNDVLIQASPSLVWRQIRSVPRIEDHEIHAGWAHLIGLPRPREAILDRDGVGAVRVATFDGGLSFRETVTDWAPGKRLSFRIRAQDPGGLDPHVRVGGRFFDVLSGTYTLEEVAPGVTLLHLSSTQRVSTHFNGYTAFFTGAIMHDLQRTILEVIRDRAEGRGAGVVAAR
ncbi:SRPBCC family protein [Deinococcus planocerae]|uniref:SRPBCC family protein n=1 Tax=Deinococcus planocerae TaxID=1737569 RepID=UPI000C7ECFE0|nr:SRPBCC family protein [Deinococcus planocerae]